MYGDEVFFLHFRYLNLYRLHEHTFDMTQHEQGHKVIFEYLIVSEQSLRMRLSHLNLQQDSIQRILQQERMVVRWRIL